MGSKVGVAVGALASHQSVTRVRFQWLARGLSLLLVLSLLRGDFLEFSKFFPSTKTNTSKFQFNLDVKCLHMMCGPHTTTLNLIYLFFFTSNVRYIFLNVSLFQFTRYLHCLASLPFSIYMIFTGFGPPNLHVIYRV